MIQFAITCSSFQRKDGKTPFLLKRALDSVFAQIHQDFTVYVIGDKYEDNTEFENIVSSYPQEKIYYENLPYAKERDKYTNNKNALWNAGGVNASNYALDIALKDGFKYICTLDHDDYWTNEHLSSLNEVIEETNADWLCTSSTYCNYGNLPRVKTQEKYVVFLPVPCGVINSSTCINFSTIPIRFRDVFEEEGKLEPADADRHSRCVKYIKDNKLKSYFVNKHTCFHIEEQYIIKG